MSYAWGGLSNGQIPADRLRNVRGVLLRADAAEAAELMAQAFEARFGRPLRFTEGYRALGSPGDYRAGRANTQWYYWERRQANPSAPAAAYPGGSIHGWALALDVDLTGLAAEQVNWLHTEGRAYGWNWETTGRPSDEPWHLDFNLPVTASGRGSLTIAQAIALLEVVPMLAVTYISDQNQVARGIMHQAGVTLYPGPNNGTWPQLVSDSINKGLGLSIDSITFRGNNLHAVRQLLADFAREFKRVSEGGQPDFSGE